MQIFITFLIKFLTASVSFGLLILSAQILGASGRGSVTLIATNIAIVVLINGFVGGASLMYLLSKYNNLIYASRIVGVSYIWAPISSLIVAALTSYLELVDANLILDTFLLGWLAALTAINALLVLSNRNIVLYNCINLIQIGGCLVFFCFSYLFVDQLAVRDYLHGLYVSYSVSFIISGLVAWRFLNGLEESAHGPSMFDSILELFKLGALSQISNLFLYINYRLSYYLLSISDGLDDVGIYSVGVMLSEVIWMVSGSFAIVLYMHAVKSRGDDRLAYRAISYIKICFLTSIVFILVLMLIPSEAYISIFGSQFVGVKASILFLSVAMISSSVSTILNHFFAGVGEFVINAKVSFIAFVFSLALNSVLIPKFGFLGAATVASMTGLLMLFLFVQQFLRLTNLSSYDLAIRKKDLVSFNRNLLDILSSYIKKKS